ncbi:copia protein [Tanacetum coccineum]
MQMYWDNSDAIIIANEPGVQKGAIHYQRRYHYVRECIEFGEINLLKFHTNDNIANMFTKALPKGKLTQHARSIRLQKDFEIYKGKKERVNSIALKAKKESSDDETSTFESNDEEYAMAVRNVKSSLEEKVNLLGNQEKKRSHSDKGMRRKEIVTENALDAVIQIISLAIIQNHLATKIKMPLLEVLGAIAKMMSKTKLMMKLVSWLNCQMRYLRTCLEPDEWIKDSGCSKHMTGNKSLLSTCKAYDGEPKDVKEALKDESWVVSMQEELNQFVANDVWELVLLPMSQSVIGTKWVFRNKLDENGIVSRIKARLVAQRYNQQEGIDYDETYASVARLESVRILLAIAHANDGLIRSCVCADISAMCFRSKRVPLQAPILFLKIIQIY